MAFFPTVPKVLYSILSMYFFFAKFDNYFFFNFFFNVLFIFGTERDRAWTGVGQRERETQNRKQAPGSEPSAQSLTRGSNSRTARSWPGWTARSWPGWSRTLNRLRHPGAPNNYFLIFFILLKFSLIQILWNLWLSLPIQRLYKQNDSQIFISSPALQNTNLTLKTLLLISVWIFNRREGGWERR